jgi:O-antigen ligase
METDLQKKRSRRRWDNVCQKIIDYGIIGLLIFCPLPAASVNDWSVFIIQLAVLVMMAAYVLKKPDPLPNTFLPGLIKWPKYFFLGFWILVCLQICPLPKFLVKWLSPNAYGFLRANLPDFSGLKFLSLSLIPAHTLKAGLALLPYFLFGFLIFKTVRRSSQIIRIYSVLLVMGIFEAFYGLFELTNKNPHILFYKKVYSLDVVTGTFVNRNHLAGYLEMIIPLGIGLILARVNFFSLAGLPWREKFLRLSEKGFVITLLMSFGILVMAVAVMFSRSRSGIFLLIFAFILFFVLIVLHFDRQASQKKWLKSFMVIISLGIIILSVYLGIEASFERFSPEQLLHEDRPAFWSNTLRYFSQYPLFGVGLGNFGSIYPHFMEEGQLVKLSHAHNDYLEYLTELGAVGMFLLLAGIFLLVGNTFLVWRARRYPVVKSLALGGIVATACILIHSITDFNLQIPANRIVFTAVLALTLVTATHRMREPQEFRQRGMTAD